MPLTRLSNAGLGYSPLPNLPLKGGRLGKFVYTPDKRVNILYIFYTRINTLFFSTYWRVFLTTLNNTLNNTLNRTLNNTTNPALGF